MLKLTRRGWIRNADEGQMMKNVAEREIINREKDVRSPSSGRLEIHAITCGPTPHDRIHYRRPRADDAVHVVSGAMHVRGLDLTIRCAGQLYDHTPPKWRV
jgi:hypothetical protein